MDDEDRMDEYYFEDVNKYRKGGFHPVHLHDVLDGRFEVVHKLGSGGFGIVWLCHDLQSNSWRAVKILTADQSSEDRESRVLQHLTARFSIAELSKHHIAVPLETFWIDGPNGRHLCYVMPLLGCTVTIWHLMLPKPETEDILARAKEVCRQIAQGLQFLHGSGVCHGDLWPQNILMRLKGVEDLDKDAMMGLIKRDVGNEQKYFVNEDQIYERDSLIVPFGTLSRNDPGSSAPKYCVVPLDAGWCVDVVTDEPLIIDFGESFLTNEPAKTTGIPTSYAAPEILLRTESAGPASDIWSLAGTITEVWSNDMLFSGSSISNMVQSWEMHIGPLPEPYRTAWRKSPDRHPRFRRLDSRESSGSEPDSPASWTSSELEEIKESVLSRSTGYTDVIESVLGAERIWRPTLPSTEHLPPLQRRAEPIWHRYPREEVLMLADLLRKMSKYKPSERLDMDAVMQHPWFTPPRDKRRFGLAAVSGKFSAARIGLWGSRVRFWAARQSSWGLSLALLSIPLISLGLVTYSRSLRNIVKLLQ